MTISNKQRFQTQRLHTVECVWCGEDFGFWSTSNPDGSAKYPVSHCSQSCTSQHNREGGKKLPSASVLKRLYVMDVMSIRAIAEKYNCGTTPVYRALKKARIKRRVRTNIRECKTCGKPPHLLIHTRIAKSDGMRVVYGTLCLDHLREYKRLKEAEYKKRKKAAAATI